MNEQSKLRGRSIAFAALLVTVVTLAQAQAQTPPQQNPDAGQISQADQMLGPLNLTPDQIQKIRAINTDLKDQRQAANFRLRQAQRALAEAIESPNPNEAVIEQRSHEVAEAQATAIRLRSLTEARILQVLTPDQRLKLREIRQRNQALRRAGNQQFPVNGLNRRKDGLPRNSNALPPLGLRQRRLMRQQRRL